MVTIFSLGYKGYFVLSQLDQNYLSLIDVVVIGRDKGVVHDYADDLVRWCAKKNIKYRERKEFVFLDSKSSFFVLIGWRWLVDANENCKLIVLHDSILPKYRGFNPLVTALIEGDLEIGGTAIFGNDDFDTGEIIVQKKIRISYPCKIQNAIDLMAGLYLDIANEIFFKLNNGRVLKSLPQVEEEATYSLWRDEEDYRIDWNQDSERIVRHIHACGDPYKGAFSDVAGIRCYIFDASSLPDIEIINRTPGKVIFKRKGNPVVVCQKGLIELTEVVDREGSRISFPNFRLRFS